MKCYTCGRQGSVYKCDTCGEVRCSNVGCTGASGKRGTAARNARCKSCRKGKYQKIS